MRKEMTIEMIVLTAILLKLLSWYTWKYLSPAIAAKLRPRSKILKNPVMSLLQKS